MTTQAHTATYSATQLSGLGALIERIKTAFSRRMLYVQTLRELSALSDHHLADLGIHRSMLRRLAYQAAYKDTAK